MYTIWQFPGLGLRVQVLGVGVWALRFRVLGEVFVGFYCRSLGSQK